MYVCVIGLQLDFLLHLSLIPDSLVGFRPPYDSTVELGWVMCHGLKGTHNQSQSLLTQIIKSLFSIQICSINLTLVTVKV